MSTFWVVLPYGLAAITSGAFLTMQRSYVRRMEQKENALKLWQHREKIAQHERDRARGLVDDRDADNIALAHTITAQRKEIEALQTRLQRYARARGADGRITGRAK